MNDLIEMLEAQGFVRAGTLRQGEEVLEITFFNPDCVEVTINYQFANSYADFAERLNS